MNMKQQRTETLAEKKRLIFNENKTSKTAKSLERLLLENGFIKTMSGSTSGGWGGDIDVFNLEFKKGNENVFITVNKPKKGVKHPMTYAEYERQKEAAN
jgi:hypothetical protein